jgi:nucleoside-diphosphate-sugar epimerase
MKILVTGPLGHIGSRLIRDIPSRFPASEVLMIDNLSTQRYSSLFNLPSNTVYRFLEGDVLDTDLTPFLTGADVAIHLAAITDAAGSFHMRDKVEQFQCHQKARGKLPAHEHSHDSFIIDKRIWLSGSRS